MIVYYQMHSFKFKTTRQHTQIRCSHTHKDTHTKLQILIGLMMTNRQGALHMSGDVLFPSSQHWFFPASFSLFDLSAPREHAKIKPCKSKYTRPVQWNCEWLIKSVRRFMSWISLVGAQSLSSEDGTHYLLHEERSLVPTCPPSETCTPQESGKGEEKSLQTPHTLDTTYSNSSPLVGTTDLCRPKPPDTKTVSSPSPSHYWTANPLWHCAINLDHYNNQCTITPSIIFIYFNLTV